MERSAVASVLRTSQAYFSQLCETESLEWGIVYASSRLAGLGCVNQFREVLIPKADQAEEAFRSAERYFEERGIACTCWTPSIEQDLSFLEPFLSDRGYEKRSSEALMLTQWRDLEVDESLRIFPARAMRAAFEQILRARTATMSASEADLCVEAARERLDDPSYEMFVVMDGGEPAGCGAMFEVGDIGRLIDFCVVSGCRKTGVGETLLAHLLGIAKRLALRMICVQTDGDDGEWMDLLLRVGFQAQGEIVEYASPWPGASLSC